MILIPGLLVLAPNVLISNKNFRGKYQDSWSWLQMFIFQINIFGAKIKTTGLGPKCSYFKYEFLGPKFGLPVLAPNVLISNKNFRGKNQDFWSWPQMFLFQIRIFGPKFGLPVLAPNVLIWNKNFRGKYQDSWSWPQMFLFQIWVFGTKIKTSGLGPKCSYFK